MNIYIIDYENVQSGVPFCGVEKLDATDEIYIFYSENANKVNEYYWNKLVKHPCCKQRYKLAHSGKNALDFCIVMEVGKILGSNRKASVAIISNDAGYKALEDYYPKVRLDERQRLVMASCIEEAASLLSAEADQMEILQKQLSSRISIGTPIPRKSEAEDEVASSRAGGWLRKCISALVS